MPINHVGVLWCWVVELYVLWVWDPSPWKTVWVLSGLNPTTCPNPTGCMLHECVLWCDVWLNWLQAPGPVSCDVSLWVYMNKGEPESKSMPESRWCAWCCVSCGPVSVRLRAILIGCWGSCVHVMHVQVVLLGLFMSLALCSTFLSIYLVTNWVIVSILF